MEPQIAVGPDRGYDPSPLYLKLKKKKFWLSIDFNLCLLSHPSFARIVHAETNLPVPNKNSTSVLEHPASVINSK